MIHPLDVRRIRTLLRSRIAPPFIRLGLLSEGQRLRLVYLAALLQGLLFLLLVPPWQHYDEPTHLERAWLMARGHWQPTQQDIDRDMRRQTMASMLEHRFYVGIGEPNLLGDHSQLVIGFQQLDGPPLYYLLASLPLRLMRHADIETQLYAARSVSLLMFLLTIVSAAGVLRELTAPGHPLRWAVPLAVALLPPLADIMTAVNDDVGAILVFSLFLWGAARLLCHGLSWPRALWVLAAGALALLTKNTVVATPALALLVLLVGLWRQRRWRWRWLQLGIAASSSALLLALLNWQSPAYWYYYGPPHEQPPAFQSEDPRAPLGQRVLQLDNDVRGGQQPLLYTPLLTSDVRRLQGATITVGAWVWASRPLRLGLPLLTLANNPYVASEHQVQDVEIGTTPTFVAWTTTLPDYFHSLSFGVTLPQPRRGQNEPITRLYIDGAVLVEGSFAPERPPSFDDASASAGSWEGRRFINLLRNPSGEQRWPALHHWAARLARRYSPANPAELLPALLDIERSSAIINGLIIPTLASTLFNAFGWGAPIGPAALITPLTLALLAASALGSLRWWGQMRQRRSPGMLALGMLGLSMGVIMALVLLRALPWTITFFMPAPRYLYPAIIPLMLLVVAGWRALWPRRWRAQALGLLLAGLVLFDGLALLGIQRYFESRG